VFDQTLNDTAARRFSIAASSRVVYAFAPQGWSVIYTGGTTATQFAADFTRLLTTTR
jgi:hypothetical protein